MPVLRIASGSDTATRETDDAGHAGSVVSLWWSSSSSS